MNFRKILLYPCSPRPFTPGAGALTATATAIPLPCCPTATSLSQAGFQHGHRNRQRGNVQHVHQPLRGLGRQPGNGKIFAHRHVDVRRPGAYSRGSTPPASPSVADAFEICNPTTGPALTPAFPYDYGQGHTATLLSRGQGPARCCSAAAVTALQAPRLPGTAKLLIPPARRS